ncbi:MAG: CpaF family protein [Chloroflexota bacterium]|nr:CpaF family protein [Chloroflexota bacterium]
MSMLLQRAQPVATEPTRSRASILSEAECAPADLFADVKERVYQRMLREIDPQKISGRDKHEVRPEIEALAANMLAMDDVPMARDERLRCASDIADEILGYGPIEPLLEDPSISEVMINGPRKVFFEQRGVLHLSDRVFRDDDHIMRIIEKIVVPINRRIDESSPMVDARLPDGSRVNAIIPPLAIDGPTVTIRKFSRDPFTVDDLVNFGTLIPEMVEFLSACIRTRLNVVVSGGTGSGKTTLLNVLSSFIPGSERVVTIEDPCELQLRQRHVIRLETRPPNVEGKGYVSARDLVRNALRMRPDRIIVGEVRAGEAFDMLQAMNTGHDGSLTTAHANAPRDAIARIENMVLMAGLDLPVRAIREQVASALDLVVHVSRLADGTRRVTHVTEVVGMEGQTVTLQDIFLFNQTGVDARGKVQGHVVSTGLRPHFMARLEAAGIHLPADTFTAGRVW